MPKEAGAAYPERQSTRGGADGRDAVSRWTRVVLASIFVVLSLRVSAFRSDVFAADEYPVAPPGSTALTRLAMTAIGQQQGECFPWVRRVVQAATGIVLGNDYRLGYLQAGAVEVTPQTARNGDIIQIANDANTAPSADYPGLHTAFILEDEGGGKFTVIDSNSNFDGVVRVRTGYAPAAVAARYPGLSFHIYRLPERALGVPAPAPPASFVNTPGVIPIGSAAEIAADGDCLRVRTIAGLSGTIVGCLPTGARVTVTQPGPDVDGYHWVTISNGAISGWASERYLRAVNRIAVVPAAPPVVPTPVSTVGRILNGVIPPRGIALIVFGGGTDAQLLAASGCPRETASFWTFQDGQFVRLIAGASVPVVNAEWRNAFPDGIPSDIALMASCRPMTETSSEFDPNVAPVAASTPAPAATAPATPSATTAPSHYTVVEGDSLSGIAERFHGPDISIGKFLDALYDANGLTADSMLSLGQVLRIPR